MLRNPFGLAFTRILQAHDASLDLELIQVVRDPLGYNVEEVSILNVVIGFNNMRMVNLLKNFNLLFKQIFPVHVTVSYLGLSEVGSPVNLHAAVLLVYFAVAPSDLSELSDFNPGANDEELLDIRDVSYIVDIECTCKSPVKRLIHIINASHGLFFEVHLSSDFERQVVAFCLDS